MHPRLETFLRKTFNRVFFLELKNYALLLLVFLVPMKLGEFLWPSDPDNGLMKVAAIFIASVVCMVLLAFYKYFSFRILKIETAEDDKQETKQ